MCVCVRTCVCVWSFEVSDVFVCVFIGQVSDVFVWCLAVKFLIYFFVSDVIVCLCLFSCKVPVGLLCRVT